MQHPEPSLTVGLVPRKFSSALLLHFLPAEVIEKAGRLA
jgi:hypothetical protein